MLIPLSDPPLSESCGYYFTSWGGFQPSNSDDSNHNSHMTPVFIHDNDVINVTNTFIPQNKVYLNDGFLSYEDLWNSFHLTSTFKDCHLDHPSWMISINPPGLTWKKTSSHRMGKLIICLIFLGWMASSSTNVHPQELWNFMNKWKHWSAGCWVPRMPSDSCWFVGRFNHIIHQETPRPSSPSLL